MGSSQWPSPSMMGWLSCARISAARVISLLPLPARWLTVAFRSRSVKLPALIRVICQAAFERATRCSYNVAPAAPLGGIMTQSLATPTLDPTTEQSPVHIRKLGHVVFRVRDVERSVKFY